MGGRDRGQVDAVAPAIGAAHQGDDFGWALGGFMEGLLQAFTLPCGHGPVMEVEVDIAHAMELVVPQIMGSRLFGQAGDVQHLGGGPFQR